VLQLKNNYNSLLTQSLLSTFCPVNTPWPWLVGSILSTINVSADIFLTEQKIKKLKQDSTQTLTIGWKHKLVGSLLISHIGLQAFLPYSHFITKVLTIHVK
jgi:hypothetical protein